MCKFRRGGERVGKGKDGVERQNNQVKGENEDEDESEGRDDNEDEEWAYTNGGFEQAGGRE